MNVLIVDDSVSVRRVLAGLLKRVNRKADVRNVAA